MSEARQNVTALVYEQRGRHEWTLAEFMADLNDAVAKVPEQHRGNIIIELGGGYDDSPTLEVQFSREETDLEMAERVRRNTLWETAKARDEQALYERLHAKYGKAKP